MNKEFAYGIIPIYTNEQGEYQVLLINNKSTRYWGFPKGHIEEGEAPVQAALREFTEETGISDVNVYKQRIFKETYSFPGHPEDIDKSVGYYLGFVSNQAVLLDPHEIKAHVRLSLHEAKKKLTYLSTRLVLEKAIKFLTTMSR